MVPFQWKLVALRKARASRKVRTRDVALLVENGPVLGPMVEDVDEAGTTKERAKENPKESTRGRKAVEAKARARKVAKEGHRMANVPTVMSMAIGRRIVLTWSIR